MVRCFSSSFFLLIGGCFSYQMFQTERGEHKGKESLLNTQFNYYLVLISISEVSHGEQRKLIRRRLHTPTRAIFNYSSLFKPARKDLEKQ